MSNFNHEEFARQMILFNGLSCGTAAPTDIDGFMEKGGQKFLFYEFKCGNTPIPFGQRLALEHIADACRAAGKKAAVLMVCEHEVSDPEMNVEAAEAKVRAIYCKGEWFDGGMENVRSLTEKFLRYAEGGKNETTVQRVQKPGGRMPHLVQAVC